MNEDKVKELIASFLKIKKEKINPDTPIKPKGSVLMHRMRSALSNIGVEVDFDTHRVFSDLTGKKRVKIEKNSLEEKITPSEKSNNSEVIGIGIDIESIDNFKIVKDYFEDQFYKENFTKKEIAHCVRTDEPRRCFAGRFSCKEAIYKATRGNSGKDFDKIEIATNNDGSIDSELCSLSLSYLSSEQYNLVCSVAVSKEINKNKENNLRINFSHYDEKIINFDRAISKTEIKLKKLYRILFLLIVLSLGFFLSILVALFTPSFG